MAQTVNLRLSRADNSPWGFRLQGGKDFGQPLLIQKVNGGSLAERAGLQVGDALIRVNNVEVADMRHKDAQDTIVRAGNSMEIQVQRGGGSTWKPHVSPVGTVPLPGKASPATTVTKTSLAAGRSPAPAIGAGHNLSPKPFGASPQVNGDPSVKAIVNKQYNTPVQMYSEETIAETLSAQAEVLAGGAIGVNFMKNEKTYDSQKSEVFKMVQEVDKEPREPEQPDSGPAVGPGFGLRHVQPPEPKPAPPSPQPQQLPPGQNICADCERLIVGVFVRIKDKNLHVECFKCATCGTSLKNVGYYTINNKLYCDIHAKLVARQNPPAPNLEPVTVAPGARAPTGAFSSPHVSAAPQSPQPGTLAPLPFHAPRTTTSHVVAPRFGRQTSAPSGPKPFGSVTAPSVTTSVPFNAPPSSAPISNIPAPPAPSSFSKPLPESRTPVVWPPTTQSHFLKAEEASCVQVAEKRLSICSEEVSSIASSKLEITNSILEEDRPMSPCPDIPVFLDQVEKSLIEAGERVKRRSVSPKPPPSPRSRSPRPVSPRPMTPRHFKQETPDLLDVSSKPHEVHSLLPPACVIRPMSPKQVVVFPPEFPNVIYSRSPTPRKEKKSPDRCTTCPSPLNAVVPYKSKEEVTHSEHKQAKEKSHVTHTIKKSETSKKETKLAKEHKVEKESLKKQELSKTSTHHGRDTTMECSKKTVETKAHEDKMFYTKTEVEKLIHEEVLKALALKEEKQSTCMDKMTTKEERKCVSSEKVKDVSVHDLPKPIAPSGWMTSALTTASERPFTPVPFPKPMELPSISDKIIPMVPMEIKKDDKPVPLPSETVPYFPPPPPPPDQEGMDERTARALREVGCRSPMTEALTVAPERPYSPLPSLTEVKPSSKPESSFKPIAGPKKPMTMTSALTVAPSIPFTVPGKTPIPSETSVKVESDGTSAFKPVHPKPFVAQQKTEKYGIDMVKVATQGHTKQTVQSFETGKISKTVHETSADKHLLPYYQENIGEIPVRNRAISPVPHLIVAPSIKPTEPFIPQPPKPKQETRLSRKEAFCQSSKSNMQSDKVEYCQTKTVPPRPTTPSGLHPPEELPYYQKDIGVIPLRNKSVSPVPHLIKAPQLEVHTSTQQQQQLQQGYKSTVYSETKTFSAQQSSSKMLNTEKTKTKETAITGRKSPQVWKLETKRTVQNLSPITVRLQSPRPVTPVQGETEQAANAKVHIHRPRPSSPLPPTVKVKVDYPSVSSSGPVIGSGNSAFTSVKNGSSTLSKKSEQLSCGQKQPCEQSSNVQRQASQKSIPQKQTGEQSSVQKRTHDQSSVQKQTGEQSSIHKQTCERSSIQKQIGEQSSSAQMQIREQVSSAQEQVCKKSSGPHKATCSGASTDCTQVCEKKHCMKNGDVQHKLSQSQETIQAKSHTTASSTKAEMKQQSSTVQKTSHSGITSFRAYGETAKKTMRDEEFGGSGKHELQLQEARMSKTFEQQQGQIMHTTTKPRTDQKLTGGSQTTSKQMPGQKYEGVKIEHKHGETISANTLSKTNLLLKKPAIGDNKTSVGLSPCPLPTFPSLPQLSDVPWTPGAGGAGGRTATFAGSSAPKRGRGILNPSVAPGARIPLCGHCNMQIRGPFITALGKIWCPEHFVCVNAKCRRPLQDIGFVEEPAGLYCEYCFEQYLAPTCDKCHSKIKGDCLNAIGKHFHPECFSCSYCGKLFGNSPFFLEDALPYCEADWNELFTTKCFSCGFPIEAGDRWVEALNNNYHSQCFNCTMCKKNLEGQSFFAKAGRPFCKNHAR